MKLNLGLQKVKNGHESKHLWGGDNIADLAMCKFEQCEKKDSCRRYRASPGQYQAYMEFQNICSEKNGYQWFWEMEVKEENK